MMTVGIDPGKKGGIAMVDDNGIYQMVVMPENVTELRKVLRTVPVVCTVFIEKVHAMPGQGVVSMFNFGKGYGEVLASVELLGFNITLVPPQKWQKAVFTESSKGLPPKERALITATKLYPEQDWLATSRSKVPHSGLIDAALIATYGRRRYEDHKHNRLQL